MFKVEKIGSNRLDIALDEKLDKAAMADMLDELLEKAVDIENGLMMFDIVEYYLPSFGAISLELRRMPQLLKFIRRFNKAAVLSDQRWLKAVSELEGELIPGLEIKAFDRDDREAAELWLMN